MCLEMEEIKWRKSIINVNLEPTLVILDLIRR
jgi:hypothetical protein